MRRPPKPPRGLERTTARQATTAYSHRERRCNLPMTLNTASPFASFDVTDGAQQRDISPVLQDAIFYDLNILSALNVAFNDPVFDTTHYWNEEQLNSDQVTLSSASAASTATALSVSAGNGARLHVGDLLYDSAINSTEIM